MSDATRDTALQNIAVALGRIAQLVQFPLTVPYGGTGDTSLATHSVLLGEGVSAVSFATVGSVGAFLMDRGSSLDPAFTLASAGSLADYSATSWTPQLNFGGSHPGMTQATAIGAATRIGRQWFGYFSITFTTLGSATGAATITGFPATSNGTAASLGAGGGLWFYSGLASLAGMPFINIGTATSIASLYQPGSVASVALNQGNFTSVASIAGSFNFFI